MQSPVLANGVSPYRKGRARGENREPLRRVIGIDRDAWTVLAIALGVALLFHVGAAVRTWLIPLELLEWNRHIGLAIGDRLNETIDVDQEKPKPPPDPLPPEPEPAPTQAPPVVVKAPDQTPAPPAAAQAAAILAAKENPDEPVDLTNAFVTGNADVYAGGVTQSNGTSKEAVRNTGANRDGKTGGTGIKPGAGDGQGTGIDRSRGIQLAGSAEWRCPFPPEADGDSIDDAYATVAVTVGMNGKAESVNVVQDPGHGFGREAKACALRESFVSALDHDGNAIRATKSFRIHFER